MGVMMGGRGGRSHDSRKNRAKRDSNEPSNQRALKSNFRRRERDEERTDEGNARRYSCQHCIFPSCSWGRKIVLKYVFILIREHITKVNRYDYDP